MVDTKLRAEPNKTKSHKVHLWDKAAWPTIKQESADFSKTFMETSSKTPEMTVDQQWNLIESHLLTMTKNHVPSRMSRVRRDQPWITTALRRSCRKKQRLYKKWKKLKAQGKSCAKAREDYKQFHTETNHQLQKSRTQYINNILEESLTSGSTKSFYRYVKSQATEHVGVAPLKDKGQVHSEPEKMAKILAAQFSSVFTKDAADLETAQLHGPSYEPPPELVISVDGVEKLLKGIDPKKAAGPDQVPCRLLHELHAELAPVFTILFKNSYKTGHIPEVWKSAWITPIFKKGFQ